MGMDIKTFLESLEEQKGKGKLFESGKEGGQVPKEVKDAVEEAGITDVEWIYKPDDFDLAVVEHKADDKWSVVFFTEAEVDDEDEEDIFDEGLRLLGQAKSLNEDASSSLTAIDTVTGDFVEIVKICVEIASGKQHKKGFTTSSIKQLSQKAKS